MRTGCGSLLETVSADLTVISFRAEPSRLTSKTTRTAENILSLLLFFYFSPVF
jgi:hypothetical protein